MEGVAAAEVKIEDIVEVGINVTIHHRQETDEMTCHRQTKVMMRILRVLMKMRKSHHQDWKSKRTNQKKRKKKKMKMKKSVKRMVPKMRPPEMLKILR